jgi:hypothetical protein
LALLQEFFPKKTPSWLVMVCFVCLSFAVIVCIEKFYAKRAVNRFLYDCQLTYKDVKMQLKGFLDSGNLANKNGLPVCFISPEYFYELFIDSNDLYKLSLGLSDIVNGVYDGFFIGDFRVRIWCKKIVIKSNENKIAFNVFEYRRYPYATLKKIARIVFKDDAV